MMCGGTSQAHEANPEVQELVNKLKDQINLRTGSSYSKLAAVSYKTQVVAGTNYFVKVCADGKTYLHLRIFKPLPCHGTELELHSVQKDKAHDDPIDYF